MAATVVSRRPLLKRQLSGDSFDIDGVPLKEPGTKINLKLILGNSPAVEEDDDHAASIVAASASVDQTTTQSPELSNFAPQDDEFEYTNDEDDDDEERRERRLRRHSSLKRPRDDTISDMNNAPQIPHPSAMGKKEVHFADALGLGLANVRDLTDPDEPPEIPPSALRDLNIRRKRSKTEGLFNLALGFEQPSSSPDFMVLLRERKVVLENCVASDRDLAVSGLVRVANVAYDKRAFIRYTTDGWATQRDVAAAYVPNSSDGASDRFMFVIRLPDKFGLADAKLGRSSRVEFVICFCSGGCEHWDNNGGDNYSVNCRLSSTSV